jgi:hypothetical protein
MKKYILIFIVILLNCLNTEISAQGNLLIFPKRVVFKDKQVKSTITLLNLGEETTTFTVSFKQISMSEDGSLTTITVPDEGQFFADPYLRIYPRQVTLMSKESQTVIVQRRRKRNVPAGEYRSHLYFRSEKKDTALSPQKRDSINEVSFELTPVFGISLTVIFRLGKVNTTATISDLKLNMLVKNTALSFTINRSGNSSLYGDLTIEYYPIKGKPFIVAKTRGIAVYTTIKKRYMSLNLKMLPKMNLKEGSLKVKYTSHKGDEVQKVFAETELLLAD